MDIEFFEGDGWGIILNKEEVEKMHCMGCQKDIQIGDYFCMNKLRPVCFKCEKIKDVPHVGKLRCHDYRHIIHEHRKLCSIKIKEEK